MLLVALGLIVAVNCLKELVGKNAGSLPDEEPEWSEMGRANVEAAQCAAESGDAEPARA